MNLRTLLLPVCVALALGACVAPETSVPMHTAGVPDSPAKPVDIELRTVADTADAGNTGDTDAGAAATVVDHGDDAIAARRCDGGRDDAAVAQQGCAPFTGVIDGVDFPSGATALTASSRDALAPLLAALLQRPDVRVELQGHTDNRGRAGDNLVLSKRRVMAVVRYLVSEGVAPQRLEPWGYGESRPLASNATAQGRARNRRIEVHALAP